MQRNKFVSEATRQAFDKPRALAECLLKNRIVNCDARFPVVINFDVTGKGMCSLPQYFWHSLSDLIEATSLADAPTIYFTGIGDINFDFAPMQITNGAAFKTTSLQQELTKLWLEDGGGGGEEIEFLQESYEMMGYFLAKRLQLNNAAHAACIFVADEAPRNVLEKGELDYYFGGSNASTNAATVFAELKQKFRGNVFLIWRPSFGDKENASILAQWRALIGEDKILVLPGDRLITAAVRELLIAVANHHTIDEAQKKLNELAPKAIPPEAVVPITSTTPETPMPEEVRPSNIPTEFQLDTDTNNKPDAQSEEPTPPSEALKDLGL